MPLPTISVAWVAIGSPGQLLGSAYQLLRNDLEVPSEVALSFLIGILRELRKAVKSEITVFCSCNFCNTLFLVFSRASSATAPVADR